MNWYNASNIIMYVIATPNHNIKHDNHNHNIHNNNTNNSLALKRVDLNG